MYENGKIYMGLAGDKRVELALHMCNRHGLIAGASGTGKTITMKVMAESFSDAGVPVFLCDVKGDVAGICAPGQSSEGMEKRIDKFGLRERFATGAAPPPSGISISRAATPCAPRSATWGRSFSAGSSA